MKIYIYKTIINSITTIICYLFCFLNKFKFVSNLRRFSNLQGEIRRIKALDKIRADFKPFDALYSSCNSSGIFEAVTVIEIAGRHIKGNCVCKSKKDLMEFRADDYFLYEDTPENRGYFNTIMGCGKAREELQDKFEKEIGEIDEAIRLGCSSIKQIKKRS